MFHDLQRLYEAFNYYKQGQGYSFKQAKMQMAPRAVDFKGPRFDTMGEACGAVGVRVETLAEFEKAFAAAVSSRKFTVIDAVVDPTEYMEQM
jgi:acetolactate synthase-1/2/3 large subunit